MTTDSTQTDFIEPQMVDIFQQLHDGNHRPIGEEYLSFVLGEEIYAVDILAVQEIRTWEAVTRIPNTPGYIKGVINLRGSIVPVIDLRSYFHFKHISYLPTTVVIVMAIDSNDGEKLISIVVDAVCDVIRFTSDKINAPPHYGDAAKNNFICGLVTADISLNEQQDKKANCMVMLLEHKCLGTLIDTDKV